MDKEILKELGIEDVDALTAEQITEYRVKVIEAGKKAIEAKDVAKAEALATLADTLKARKETLDKEAKERDDKLTEFAAKFEPDPEPVEEPKEPEAPKAEDKPAEPVKVEPVAKVEPEKPVETPMPVAASSATALNVDTVTINGQTFKANAMPQPPAANTPKAPKAVVASITAAADVPHLSPGQPITDLKVLASAAADRAQGLMSNPGIMGKFPVANLQVEYPKERQLFRDAEESTDKIDAITAAAIEETRDNLRKLSRAKLDDIMSGNITADGGLCAPLNVSYDVFDVGTEVRPIRDGLVRFAATRGGIRFMTSPTLADVAGEAGGASVLVITEEQDAAGNTDKPCLVLTCGEEVEEKVDAVTKCVQIGNWSYLSYRERFNAQWRLVGVHHAREAEINLWNRLVANSSAVTSTTPILGISRDATSKLVRLAANLRSRHRVAKTTPVRVIAPDILFEMFAEDRRNQLPGDDAVATAEAEFRRELAMHNIALTLSPDIEIAGAQAAGEINDWPTSLEFLVFFEGTHLFLDMGRLDFGLMRDSTLNTSNNLRVMEETFEGIASPGFDSFHLTMGVCASGSTSGTIEVPCVVS